MPASKHSLSTSHTSRRVRSPARGFTLIELVLVVLILALLGAVALPRLVDLGGSARVAAVESLAANLRSTATLLRAACMVQSGSGACDASARMGSLTYKGQTFGMNYGWVGAGTGIGTGLIDDAVIHAGFSVSIANPYTIFALSAAPLPANCSVSYGNAWATGSITITVRSSGC